MNLPATITRAGQALTIISTRRLSRHGRYTADCASRKHTPGRTALLALLLACGLAGCQSEQDKRIARVREEIETKRAGQTAAARPKTPASPSAQSAADSFDIPPYPGAKQAANALSSGTTLANGLTMALMETGDSVDKVIEFYQTRLIPDKGAPVERKEERRDGKRSVLLTVPKEEGGLQTVQATESNGRTMIELMSLKGRPGIQRPTIPGITSGDAASSPATGSSAVPPTTGSSAVPPATGSSAPSPTAPALPPDDTPRGRTP